MKREQVKGVTRFPIDHPTHGYCPKCQGGDYLLLVGFERHAICEACGVYWLVDSHAVGFSGSHERDKANKAFLDGLQEVTPWNQERRKFGQNRERELVRNDPRPAKVEVIGAPVKCRPRERVIETNPNQEQIVVKGL